MLAPWPWVWKGNFLLEGRQVSLRRTLSRTELRTLYFCTAELTCNISHDYAGHVAMF